MLTPIAAAIYARISLDAEGEGKGVKRQILDCHRLADQLGWIVAEEYVDNDTSAYSGKVRPEYTRMLADIESGSVDGVLIYNIDRLTRRPIEFEQFHVVAERAGIPLRCATGDADFGTEDGMLLGRMQAAFAAKESAAKSRRQKRKNDEKAALGIPHSGYRRPYGFEPDKITHVPPEVRIIRKMVNQYLAGKSVMAIARWLEEQGSLTVSGNPWTSQTVRGILFSARIAGIREHRGELQTKAVWKPIITTEKRALILAEKDRRAVSGRRAPRRYLLSGLLRCSHCQGKLYAQPRQTTRRYVCSSSIDHRGCGKTTIVAGPVEELIADAVLVRLDSPELANALRGNTHVDEDLAAVADERDADTAQLLELSTIYGNKQITAAEWIEARDRIKARIDKADRRLRAAATNPALANLSGQGEELRTRWSGLDLEAQSTIVATVLDFAIIGPGTRGVRSLDPARVDPRWRV